MENKINITVKQRASDYYACINGNERKWGCGRNIDEATGSCIWNNKDYLEKEFGLKVELK